MSNIADKIPGDIAATGIPMTSLVIYGLIAAMVVWVLATKVFGAGGLLAGETS